MNSKGTILLWVVLLLVGCTQQEEGISRKEVGEYVFELQTSGSDSTGLEQYALQISLKDRKEDLISHGVHNNAELQQKLYYLSYRMQDAIYLERSGERYPCVLYHFQRSYDLKGSRTFMLGFSAGEKGEKDKIVIDAPVFDTGVVKIKI